MIVIIIIIVVSSFIIWVLMQVEVAYETEEEDEKKVEDILANCCYVNQNFVAQIEHVHKTNNEQKSISNDINLLNSYLSDMKLNMPDQIKEASVLYALGVTYFEQVTLHRSSKAAKDSLNIWKSLTEREHISTSDKYASKILDCLHLLGIVEYARGNIKESLAFFRESLAILRRLSRNNPRIYKAAVARALINMGIISLDREQKSDGLDYLEEALSILSEYEDEYPYIEYKEKAEQLRTQAQNI